MALWDVIEHIPNVEAAMRWLAQVTAPNGRVIILTPNAGCSLDALAHAERTLSARRSQRLIQLCLNRYHRHRFTRQGLILLARRSGFEPEYVRELMLYSLTPDRYLSGFAPGISGWTKRATVNQLMSRLAHKTITSLGIKNKQLFVCRRVEPERTTLGEGRDLS